MSKLDALRAMREAGHEQAMARRAAAASDHADRPEPAGRRTAAQTPPAAAPARAVTSVSPTTDSCGHRSMNGRTCTREPGHAAKSHRYS